MNVAPMELSHHEMSEWSRCATAMYARGANREGHILSAGSAVGVMSVQKFDEAAAIYRAWLVFDEPKS